MAVDFTTKPENQGAAKDRPPLGLTTQKFSQTEVAGAVSRALNLPANLPAVVELSGQVEQALMSDPQITDLSGDGFRSLVMSRVTTDVMQMLDPARREAALAEQASKANVSSAESAAALRMLGLDLAGASGQSSKRFDAMGASLDLGSITQDNYANAGALFKSAGLGFGTFSELRGQGFNAQQILSAARFTKEMGLDVNKAAPVVALLQRDVTHATEGMRDIRDNERELANAQAALKAAEKSGASAEEVEKLRQRVGDWEKYRTDYHVGFRDQAESQKSGRGATVDSYSTLQRELHDAHTQRKHEAAEQSSYLPNTTASEKLKTRENKQAAPKTAATEQQVATGFMAALKRGSGGSKPDDAEPPTVQPEQPVKEAKATTKPFGYIPT